jgi:CheY-like chemotaxis protein
VPCSLTIRSDRRLLRRLLQNLVSNAIKYTPKGRVLVGCRLRGSNLRIDVYDTGLGIPASKRKVIFREFHRLDEGAKVARGLGLGLSIVQRIGRVLDHKIDLRSALGHGSRFSVEVPLSSAMPSIQTPREPATIDRGRLMGITVLCIDNEPKVLDGMDALLGGWGCRVLKAPDAATAIDAITESQAAPNGLLIDYHLDRGNGLDAIAELRRKFGADLPAILITADRSPHVRDAARTQDVQVLSKPLKPAALRALMAQWHVQRVAAE